MVDGTCHSWTREQGQAIINEAERAPTVSEVARRHGLTPAVVFRWRRKFWDESHRASVPAEPAFVSLALPAPVGPGPEPEPRAGVIEIELAGGHRLPAEVGVWQEAESNPLTPGAAAGHARMCCQACSALSQPAAASGRASSLVAAALWRGGS